MKKGIKWFLVIIFLILLLFGFYSNSLLFVNPKTVEYYEKLKEELKNKGYKTKTYVISGKRPQFFNSLLAKYGNAHKNSTHLKGEAIDILVFDINDDDESNHLDVDIVYDILNNKIISKNGGIGTYKKRSGFFTRQMVHFDCRGYWARWHK